ncbi:hypothetical protein, partial [Rhizobium lusitanum]|uniref:hypothetical protein n=1 Tax=Rhizobium lusitanum TaxID=293958 RepID=UPI001AEDA9C1
GCLIACIESSGFQTTYFVAVLQALYRGIFFTSSFCIAIPASSSGAGSRVVFAVDMQSPHDGFSQGGSSFVQDAVSTSCDQFDGMTQPTSTARTPSISIGLSNRLHRVKRISNDVLRCCVASVVSRHLFHFFVLHRYSCKFVRRWEQGCLRGRHAVAA